VFAAINLTTKLTKSSLLRRSFGLTAPVIRPPWALQESDFQDICTGCDKCIAACPPSILKKARGGYPIVDFSNNECTFCGDCLTVCKPRALQKNEAAPPWNLIACVNAGFLSSAGITCRVCGDRCDARAITFKHAVGGKVTPVIDLPRCTGCGACVAPCPVDAIQIQIKE